MKTHLYCVLPHEVRSSVPPGLNGLSGEAVRALSVDGLIAWVSDVTRESRTHLYDGVQAHDAVVAAALETGTTPAPVRFGQRFDNDDACRAALASRSASVESVLADIQGHVEMTLLITASTRRMLKDLEPVIPEIFEPAARGAGRKYLETLREREAMTGAMKESIEELGRRLGEAVGAFVRRAAVHDAVTTLPLRTVSHLIRRKDVAPYKERVSSVEPGRESRFLVIGPRAPYSFSALANADSAHGMKLAD
jgi:hypothetical protein